MIDVSHPIVFAFLTRVADRAADRITRTPKLEPQHPLERKIEVLERQLESLRKVRAEVEKQGTAGSQAQPPQQGAAQARPYSNYAPWMSSTPTSCIACARGHLGAVQAGIRRALESLDDEPPVPADPGSPYGEAREKLIQVAGTLKEALRFARDDGMDHPEVRCVLPPWRRPSRRWSGSCSPLRTQRLCPGRYGMRSRASSRRSASSARRP